MLACPLSVLSDQMAILMSSACHAMPAQHMVSIRKAAYLDQLAKASNVCVKAASKTLTYLFPVLSWQIPGDITSHANLLSRKVVWTAIVSNSMMSCCS